MSTFINVPGTALYYFEEITDFGFVGFVTVDGSTDTELSMEQTWEEKIGYYLFVRTPLGPLAAEEYQDVAFAISELLQGVEDQSDDYYIEQSSFLWLIYAAGMVESAGRVKLVSTTYVGDTGSDGSSDPSGGGEGSGGDGPPADGSGSEASHVTVVEQVSINLGGYCLPIDAGMAVTYREIEGEGIRFSFMPPADPRPRCPDDGEVPDGDPDNALFLWLSGALAGVFDGMLIIGDLYSSGCTSWNVGLRYVAGIDGQDVHQFYPIFDLKDCRHPLFRLRWCPLDPLNGDRTYLAFLGTSILLVTQEGQACPTTIATPDRPELLRTYFRTVTGQVVAFIAETGGARPARLVFEILSGSGADARYYLVPSGEFTLTLVEKGIDQELDFNNHATELPARFLCGLSGVESVEFNPPMTCVPGDRIVFFPGKPAYAPEYPIVSSRAGVSTTWSGPPVFDVDLRLLTDDYRTAWASFLPSVAASPVYYAQPEYAPLYIPAAGPILKLFEPVASALMPADDAHCFPIVPEAGASPSAIPLAYRDDFLKRFEAEVLTPWRRERIRTQVGPNETGPAAPAGAPSGSGATTQGLKATVDGVDWSALLLAASAAGTSVAFYDLHPTLQAAFQSSQLFLVATDPRYLSTLTTFESTIRMGDWTFGIDLDRNGFGRLFPGDADGDFRDLNNTVIFKFSPGAIRDRIRKPKSWTNAASFNDYGTTALADLALRLNDFITYAGTKAATDPAYQRFMAIVSDPTWTGVLALNVSIGADLPSELQVLTAGVDYDLFVAHHIAVEASYIEYGGAPAALRTGDASVFGLIDYVQPQSAAANPALVNDFDFAVKEFRVWFDNGALREFKCAADLTINRLFDEQVKQIAGGGSAASNAIRLVGVRETKGGRPGYSFNLEGGKTFELNSFVIGSVEIRKAEFSSTSEPAQNGSTMRSTFAFHGGIRFKVLNGNDRFTPANAGTFDMMSFEPLAFEGLALDMTFLRNPPNPPGAPQFTFSTARMAFDMAPGSTALRAGSLVRKFPMKLQSFTRSAGSGLPGSRGFVPVAMPILSDVLKPEIWYAFEFELNLGTLGELAANAGLAVRMLASWSPGSDKQRVGLWLKFPGVSGGGNDLFSVEGVIKIGARAYEMRQYPDGADTGYILMLDNFALRVLGISLPPGGGPNIFIFGNPTADAEDDKLGWLGAYSR